MVRILPFKIRLCVCVLFLERDRGICFFLSKIITVCACLRSVQKSGLGCGEEGRTVGRASVTWSRMINSAVGELLEKSLRGSAFQGRVVVRKSLPWCSLPSKTICLRLRGLRLSGFGVGHLLPLCFGKGVLLFLGVARLPHAKQGPPWQGPQGWWNGHNVGAALACLAQGTCVSIHVHGICFFE